ncbi:MAG: hypothetical protein ACI4BB_03970 [Coprococcus sp.]
MILYKITMQTPIGPKHGALSVETLQAGAFKGFLQLLNHTEPFQGTIDASGSCHISGRLISLMHTVLYQASGKIDNHSLNLIINDGKRSFNVTGTACSDRKEQNE